MCLAYDPFRWADTYDSKITQMIEDGILNLTDLVQLYEEGLITKEEFEDGKECYAIRQL